MKNCKGCTMERSNTERHGTACVTQVPGVTLSRTWVWLAMCDASSFVDDKETFARHAHVTEVSLWSVAQHRGCLARVTWGYDRLWPIQFGPIHFWPVQLASQFGPIHFWPILVVSGLRFGHFWCCVLCCCVLCCWVLSVEC